MCEQYHNRLCFYADVNECDIDNGGCSDHCHNTDGSYSCTCEDGHILSNDGRTCLGNFILLA